VVIIETPILAKKVLASHRASGTWPIAFEAQAATDHVAVSPEMLDGKRLLIPPFITPEESW
jgi:hypothetical protein